VIALSEFIGETVTSLAKLSTSLISSVVSFKRFHALKNDPLPLPLNFLGPVIIYMWGEDYAHLPFDFRPTYKLFEGFFLKTSPALT